MIILSRFVINGHSMEPTIKENQTVIVSAIPYLLRTPKINDIIAIESPVEEKILIKRITKMNHNNYLGRYKTKKHAVMARNRFIIANKLFEYPIQEIKA